MRPYFLELTTAREQLAHERSLVPGKIDDAKRATRSICKDEEEERVARDCVLAKAFHCWSMARDRRLMEEEFEYRLMRQIEIIRSQRELMLKNAPHAGELFFRWRWWAANEKKVRATESSTEATRYHTRRALSVNINSLIYHVQPRGAPRRSSESGAQGARGNAEVVAGPARPVRCNSLAVHREVSLRE